MDTLYFAFANHPDRRLSDLEKEDAEINRLLLPPAARGHFLNLRDSFATVKIVAETLRSYRNQIVLFHFGGHAGSDRIDLEGRPALAQGLADLLGQCPNLQLVVLNGCATIGQVRYLHEKGIPAVLATHRAVGDTQAGEFAVQFYRALVDLDPLEKAFHFAQAAVKLIDDQWRIEISRGLALRNQPDNTPCWALSLADGRENMLQWKLPHQNPGPATPNRAPYVDRSEAEAGAFAQEMRAAIARGKINDAISRVCRYMEETNHPLQDDITQISQAWNTLARNIRMHFIGNGDANIERALIVSALLEILRKLDGSGI